MCFCITTTVCGIQTTVVLQSSVLIYCSSGVKKFSSFTEVDEN